MEYTRIKERIGVMADTVWCMVVEPALITLEQRIAGLATKRSVHDARIDAAERMLCEVLASYCKAAYTKDGVDYQQRPDHKIFYYAVAYSLEERARQKNDAKAIEEAMELRIAVVDATEYLQDANNARGLMYNVEPNPFWQRKE